MWKPEFLANAAALPLHLSGQSVKWQNLSEERRSHELTPPQYGAQKCGDLIEKLLVISANKRFPYLYKD